MEIRAFLVGVVLFFSGVARAEFLLPDAQLFTPLWSTETLTCVEVEQMSASLDAAYPNPFLKKRVQALASLLGCGEDVAGMSSRDVRSHAELVPAGNAVFRSGEFACRFLQPFDVTRARSFEIVEIGARFSRSEKTPSCLPKEWTWFWKALRHYQARQYVLFERITVGHSAQWTQQVAPFHSWFWEKLILSGKKRGDRAAVLGYYRKWSQAVKHLPRLARFDLDLWLLRWEAMLGKPERVKPIVTYYKRYCSRPARATSDQCKEFLSTWLSRFWYEKKDSGLAWIPGAEKNNQVLWWQAQRALSEKRYSRAEFIFKRIEELDRAKFWATFARASHRRKDKTALWERYLTEEGGASNLYKLFATKSAGKTPEKKREVASVPVALSLDEEGVPLPPLVENAEACTPKLSFLWSSLEKRGAKFLVEDDLRWTLSRSSEQAGGCQNLLARHREKFNQYCLSVASAVSEGVPFQKLFKKVSREEGVPSHLLMGLARQESAFCPRAVSRADALGLLQLQWSERLKGSGWIARPEQLFDPLMNMRAGAKELRRLHRQFKGNWFLALAAYNAGDELVTKWRRARPHSSTLQFVELIPFLETRLYVGQVFNHWVNYELMDKNDRRPLKSLQMMASL